MEGDCLGFGSGGEGMFCSVLVGGWWREKLSFTRLGEVLKD
jgi:hypothetical protein